MSAKDRLVEIDREIESLEEERRKLYKESLSAPDNEKLCEDWIADQLAKKSFVGTVRYPVVVNGIDISGEIFDDTYNSRKTGQLVAIRPCFKERGNRTFLGVYLGDFARYVSCTRNRESRVLHISPGGYNPAIYVPDLGRVVYGCESWWGPLQSKEALKSITDEDINNVWYMKALKQLEEGEQRDADASSE